MVSGKPPSDQSSQDHGNVSLQERVTEMWKAGSAKIYLEGHPLENKSVTDYLGVTIDSQLTFRQHVARVTSRVYGALKTLCHVKASLPTVTRILLYRTLVLPHLEYCLAIWDPHTAELTSKVESVQNRAMRYILDRPP